ncbi:hypothetical protein N7470_000512 [Penicillium chermesinum]|nr:hypothetical protein N7470_000512 [Penicillium chermesinum]
MQGSGGSWQDSGYVVAWDRRLGHLIGLFVGAGVGIVNPGRPPGEAPFGPMLYICPDEMRRSVRRLPSHSRTDGGSIILMLTRLKTWNLCDRLASLEKRRNKKHSQQRSPTCI